MVSKKVQTRCENFCQSLKNVRGHKVELMCKEEAKQLRESYKLSYVRAIFTVYRATLKSIGRTTYTIDSNKKNINYLFLVDNEEQAAIENPSKANAYKNNDSLKDIVKPLELIKVATDLLDYSKVQIVATGLCLLTGRRVTEIMKTANFIRIAGSTEKLMFSGQLKMRHVKRGRKSEKERNNPTNTKKRSKNHRYKIYTLANAAKCQEALKYIRDTADTTELSNEEVKARYTPAISYVCKKRLSKYLGNDVHPHLLRAAYGALAMARHMRTDQSDIHFLATALGHNENDLTTATRYKKFTIPTI